MGTIDRISSNTPWEPVFGYSRAVRAGEWLAISGTTATDERGMLVGCGQMYVQAKQALLNIKAHVERAGLSIGNVVRTRVFVTDISRFGEVARAHKEMFGENPPAASCVEVTRLVHPDMLVEIEADVYAGGEMAVAQGAFAAEQSRENPPPPAKKKRSAPSATSRSKPTRKR